MINKCAPLSFFSNFFLLPPSPFFLSASCPEYDGKTLSLSYCFCLLQHIHPSVFFPSFIRCYTRTLWCARSTATTLRRRSEPSESKQQATAGLSTEAALGLELAVAEVAAAVDLSTTTKTRLPLQTCLTESLTQITRKRFTRSVALRVGCGRSVDTRSQFWSVKFSDFFCFSVLLLICEIWNKNEL